MSSPRYSLIFGPFYLVGSILRWVGKVSLPRRRSSASASPAIPSTLLTDGEYLLDLDDGAKLSYQILGSEHQARAEPIVLICGMSSLMLDYEPLSDVLRKSHPVILYNHRGMGLSTLGEDRQITIERLALDLKDLISHLKLPRVALCGYSMGGVVAQQLLTLPFKETNPVELPFVVSHVLLACTRCKVHENTGLKITPQPPQQPLTPEQRMAISRRVVANVFDPTWIEANPDKFNALLERSIKHLSSRPHEVIAGQGAALLKFKFDHLLGRIPKDVQILVVHGQLDQVIPPFCADEILENLPQARFAEVGNSPGQIPSRDFGHYFFHYFEPRIWADLLCTFVDGPRK